MNPCLALRQAGTKQIAYDLYIAGCVPEFKTITLRDVM